MTGKRVLVVDDEIHIVHVVAIKLRNNGYEVKLRQRQETKDIPVIMLTARSFAIPKEQQEDLRISGCLSKPFSPKELLGNIEDVLYQRQVMVSS